MKGSVLFFTPLLIVAALAVAVSFAGPADAVSVSTVDLTSCVSNGFNMAYDSTNGVVWIAEGISTDAIAKISLTNVLVNGCTSVAPYSGVLPASSGSVGNFAGGPFGLVLQGGYVWVSGIYNSGVGVSQINPSNGAVVGTWYHATTGGASMGQMVGDGSAKLYLSSPDSYVLVFDTTLDSFSTISTNGHAVYGLVLSGSTLWFTTQDSTGLGKVQTDGTGLTLYSAGTNGVLLSLDGSGDAWFTSNSAHTLMELPNGGSSVNSYSYGETALGPVGVLATTAGVYVWGWANYDIKLFNTGLLTFSTVVSGTTDKPYTGFQDSSGNVWGLALGSVQLMQFSTSSAPSTLTTTITSIVSQSCDFFARSCVIAYQSGGTSTTTSSSTSSTSSTSSSSSTSSALVCQESTKDICVWDGPNYATLEARGFSSTADAQNWGYANLLHGDSFLVQEWYLGTVIAYSYYVVP